MNRSIPRFFSLCAATLLLACSDSAADTLVVSQDTFTLSVTIPDTE